MKRINLLLLCLSSLLFQGEFIFADLYIGNAQVSITPDQPVALEGFFHLRISKGVDSPVTASVVVVESRDENNQVSEQSVFVSADLVHIPWEMVHAVRKSVAEKLPKLDVSKIFISVTHTHAGPVVMRDNFILPEGVLTIKEYQSFFTGRVTKAIVKAYSQLKPGRLAWGIGHAQVAYNRRPSYLDGSAQLLGPTHRANYKGPEGPEYQGIPALFFFDSKYQPIACALNVWSPSQEAWGAGDKLSADFWHYVRLRLQKKFGKDFTVIAWCGPSGDQMTTRQVHTEAEDRMRRLRGVDNWVEEFGRRVADSALDTFEVIKKDVRSKVKHTHLFENIRLPGWKLSASHETSIRDHMKALEEELQKYPGRAPRLARPISWRKQTLERQKELKKDPEGKFSTELHIVRFDDVIICTNQFELFTEYGLRILGRSDAHLNFVVQLTGPAHYLPTKEAVKGGSYSAVPESCHASPEGGQSLVDQTVQRINDLLNPLVFTLPEEGMLSSGKPAGQGWENLLTNSKDWKFETDYWKFINGRVRGESKGGDYHYALTKKSYKNFELQAVLKMTGSSTNSGVGLRLQPKSLNEVHGYQADMGSGYWGCLWEEGGEGMLDEFPQKHVGRLVKESDWNHYYIKVEGEHIQAWLNGVQTINYKSASRFKEGPVGFELCHGQRHTILEVKTFLIRELP